MPLLDSALKLGAKGLNLGKKLFGVGAPKAAWNNKYAQVMGKKTLIQKANKAGVVGRYASNGLAGAVTANTISRELGGPSFGGNGPEGDEFQERAYNQLRYGADMTDDEIMSDLFGVAPRTPKKSTPIEVGDLPWDILD